MQRYPNQNPPPARQQQQHSYYQPEPQQLQQQQFQSVFPPQVIPMRTSTTTTANEKLKQELDIHQKRNLILQGEIDKCVLEISRLGEVNDHFKGLDEQHLATQAEIQSKLESEIDSHNDTKETLEAVLSENTSLQQKIDAVLIENTAHVKHIKDLSLQKEMMECSLNEMKGNGHQMGAVNNQVEQGLFEAKAELDTAKAEKENLLKRIADLEAHSISSEKVYHQLRSVIESDRDRMSALEFQLTQATAALERSEDHRIQAEESLTKNLQNALADLGAMRRDLASKGADKALYSQAESLSIQIGSLMQTQLSLISKNRDLSEQLASYNDHGGKTRHGEVESKNCHLNGD